MDQPSELISQCGVVQNCPLPVAMLPAFDVYVLVNANAGVPPGIAAFMCGLLRVIRYAGYQPIRLLASM
jgi:hypothetical protein